MEIFSRKSLLNNDFLEKLARYVFDAIIFDGRLRYDANERAAQREEKARSRLSSKLHFSCGHLPRADKQGNHFRRDAGFGEKMEREEGK